MQKVLIPYSATIMDLAQPVGFLRTELFFSKRNKANGHPKANSNKFRCKRNTKNQISKTQTTNYDFPFFTKKIKCTCCRSYLAFFMRYTGWAGMKCCVDDDEEIEYSSFSISNICGRVQWLCQNYCLAFAAFGEHKKKYLWGVNAMSHSYQVCSE